MDKRSDSQFPMSHVKVISPLHDDDIPQFGTRGENENREHTTHTNKHATSSNTQRDWGNSGGNKDKFESSTFIRHPQTKKVMGAGYAGPSYEEGDAPIDSPSKARQISFNRASNDAVQKAKRGVN